MASSSGGSRADRAGQKADARKKAAGTEVAETQGAASVAVVEADAAVARSILAPMMSQLELQLARQIPVEAFMRTALTMLMDEKSGPALMNCDRPTLYKALLDAARFGLMPGTDECAIVAYGTTATFLPQYQGYVKMFFNTGQVSAVVAKVIYKRDFWTEEYGDGRGFYHKPLRFTEDGEDVPRARLDINGNVVKGPGDDNPPILAYCFIRFKDGSRTEVEIISKQEAVEVRDHKSRSYANAEKSWNGRPPRRNSTWHTDFLAMWLKTAVRRAAKYAPKSPEILDLILADNAGDGLLPGRPVPPPFSPGGPAAAWPGDVEHGNGSVIPGTAEPADGENGGSAPAGAAPAGTAAAAGTGSWDPAWGPEERR
jgi:phage RecT family recombinase